jgi:methionine-rich copper-binding protein CopC
MIRSGARHSGAVAFAVALLLGCAAWLAAPALAHSDLVSADPADGSVLEAAPATVLLSFSEPIAEGTAAVSMEDDTGMVVRILDLQVQDADLVVAWPPGMTGTDYNLNYRVVSADGHPVEGSLAYTLAATAPEVGASAVPAPTAAAPAPGDTEDAPSGPNATVIAIAVGIGVGMLVGLILVLFRKQRTDS